MFYMQAVGLDHSTAHIESDSSACIFISTPSLHTPHVGVASTDPTLTYSPPASSLPTIVDCHHSLAEVPQADVPQDQQLEERPRRNPVRNKKCWQCGTELIAAKANFQVILSNKQFLFILIKRHKEKDALWLLFFLN